MAKCKFCEMFEDIKRIHNQNRREGFSNKYTCALVSETYRGEKFRGRTLYGGMELNYCPECGQAIDWEAKGEDDNGRTESD